MTYIGYYDSNGNFVEADAPPQIQQAPVNPTPTSPQSQAALPSMDSATSQEACSECSSLYEQIQSAWQYLSEICNRCQVGRQVKADPTLKNEICTTCLPPGVQYQMRPVTQQPQQPSQPEFQASRSGQNPSSASGCIGAACSALETSVERNVKSNEPNQPVQQNPQQPLTLPQYEYLAPSGEPNQPAQQPIPTSEPAPVSAQGFQLPLSYKPPTITGPTITKIVGTQIGGGFRYPGGGGGSFEIPVIGGAAL